MLKSLHLEIDRSATKSPKNTVSVPVSAPYLRKLVLKGYPMLMYDFQFPWEQLHELHISLGGMLNFGDHVLKRATSFRTLSCHFWGSRGHHGLQEDEQKITV